MCGIAGFYGFKNDTLLKKFSKQLEHRGPDGEGFYIDKTVSLMNRRLAIIDRATGNQPIYNEDKSVVVVYNGEIYNYLELRKELEEAGHTFTTQSDTEVIVHGYEQWGELGFDRYNGMFGIALYDKKKKKLFLARDHFGIKPLYYTFSGKKLLFASEISPLIDSGLIKKAPNDRTLYRYLRYRVHDDSQETFFENVYKILPGEVMVYDGKKATKSFFSNLKDELVRDYKTTTNKSDTDVFKKKLVESVQMRLVSEVPVGSALSGGIDSSTIVAIINQLLSQHVKETDSVGNTQQTFSAVFPGSSNNEEAYVDLLVSTIKNQIECHKIYPKQDEFFKELEEFVATQEEPTISTGPYAQYKVMEEARNFVTVLLDGQGSDEMLAGYLPYYFVYLKQLWREQQYPKFFKEVLYAWDIIFPFIWRKIKLLTGLTSYTDVSHVLHYDFFNEYQDEVFSIENSHLKKRLVEDIFTNSLPSLLRYEDKNSMRFSLEGRVPFLDINLLKFIFTLSDEAIIKNGWNKYILRESTRDILPPKIRKRRNKIGFTTPEYEWFMNQKDKVYAIFLSQSFASRKYFNQQNVLKLFRAFIEKRTTDTMFFWRLVNVEVWLRIFFDEKKPTASLHSYRNALVANEGKSLALPINSALYYRFPILTDPVERGQDIRVLLDESIRRIIPKIARSTKHKKLLKNKWFVVVSEKIVAISQGRSYFIWDIRPSFIATYLSKFVKKTPYGIGLGSPWTMQIAISEVGLPKILFASFLSMLTKPFGKKGTFYRIVGQEVAAIDGPTEYSLYPSNVSAKLGPKNPQKEAEKLTYYIKEHLDPKLLTTFGGVAIIDANDLGRNVLGNASSYDNVTIENIFQDNPLGQATEQTPLAIVFEQKSTKI